MAASSNGAATSDPATTYLRRGVAAILLGAPGGFAADYALNVMLSNTLGAHAYRPTT